MNELKCGVDLLVIRDGEKLDTLRSTLVKQCFVVVILRCICCRWRISAMLFVEVHLKCCSHPSRPGCRNSSHHLCLLFTLIFDGPSLYELTISSRLSRSRSARSAGVFGIFGLS